MKSCCSASSLTLDCLPSLQSRWDSRSVHGTKKKKKKTRTNANPCFAFFSSRFVGERSTSCYHYDVVVAQIVVNRMRRFSQMLSLSSDSDGENAFFVIFWMKISIHVGTRWCRLCIPFTHTNCVGHWLSCLATAIKPWRQRGRAILTEDVCSD